jgi:putative redox protein
MNTNKSIELEASIKLVNDKLNFIAEVEGNKPISIDYIPPLGDNLGYTSLELLLLSFSSCIGSALLVVLRKMKKTINRLEINAKGIRKETHPTSFKTIFIDIKLISPDTVSTELDKVLKISEEQLCPVWSMIKGNVEVKIQYSID